MPGRRDLYSKWKCDFRSDPRGLSTASELITKEIQKRFGHKVPVMLRTTGEMRGVIRENPFLEEGAAEDVLHVMFLADLPQPGSSGEPRPGSITTEPIQCSGKRSLCDRNSQGEKALHGEGVVQRQRRYEYETRTLFGRLGYQRRLDIRYLKPDGLAG